VELVLLKVGVGALHAHQRVAGRASVLEHQRLVEQLETLDVLDGARGRVDTVEHHEGLSLALQAALSHHLQDCSILAKQCLQRRHQRLELDALIDVTDLRLLGYGGE
jgi:hypothetical protein